MTITIKTSREGVLTRIDATCTDDAETVKLVAIINQYTSRDAYTDGLDTRVTCKRSEAENILRAIETHNSRPVTQTVAQIASKSGHRTLIAATPNARMVAQKIEGFTGFGKEFRAGEQHDVFWGEDVQYAYYR